MAIQLQGQSGTVAQTDTNTRALYVTPHPNDPGALGCYAKALTSGTIAAGLGAAAPVFSFRYTAANVCVIRRITLSIGVSTAFATGFISLSGFVARTFTASDSGGTAGTFTGNNAKLRTSYATTGIGDIRISSTAALTPGTRTLDSDPFGTASVTALTATATSPATPPFDLWRPIPGDQPLVLGNNEGFVIQASVPGTGTWQLGVAVAWDELAAAP